MADRYRSWVVRAWSRHERGVVRLTIEEVRSGLLVELRGERAAEIADLISAASNAASTVAPMDDPSPRDGDTRRQAPASSGPPPKAPGRG